MNIIIDILWILFYQQYLLNSKVYPLLQFLLINRCLFLYRQGIFYSHILFYVSMFHMVSLSITDKDLIQEKNLLSPQTL